jgi:hypothetical protein
MTNNTQSSGRKLKIFDLLAFVALLALGFTVSRSYYLEKQHERQMRAGYLSVASGKSLVNEEPTLRDWLRDPLFFYEIVGMANSSLVVCGFGIFFLQVARSGTAIRALVCQPGGVASLCCVTVVLVHPVPGLVWWTRSVAQRGVFAPHWTYTMSIAEAEVRGAVLAVWLVLFMSKCMRFNWNFFEIVGVVLGFVWILQILALAVRSALH